MCVSVLQEEEERQRQDILTKKQEQEQTLAAKAANIARIRRLAHAQAAVRKQVQKEAEQKRKAQVGAVGLLLLVLVDCSSHSRERLPAKQGRFEGGAKHLLTCVCQRKGGRVPCTK